MSDSMMERVAKALFAKEWKVESGWTFDQEMANDASGDMRRYWLDSARAAIAAMREPTEAMIEASWSTGQVAFTELQPAEPDAQWKAMIDAALSEGNKQ